MSKTIELFREYEAKLAGVESLSQNKLAERWEEEPMLLSRYANHKRAIPLWRIVWAYNRYRKLGLTPEEILKAVQADYPPEKLNLLIETFQKP